MPFSETEHGNRVVTTKQQWDHFYDAWIKRAVASYKKLKLTCDRSAAVPGNFIRGIVSDLAESFLVIADVTGSKANVFYELGIRHALRTGTILITQDLKCLPSDLNGYYAFEYTYSDRAHEYETHFQQFEKDLHTKIDAFVSGKVHSDSPVSDFLGFRKEVYDKILIAEKAQLKRIVEECSSTIEANFQTSEFLLGALTKGKMIPLKKWPIIDVVPIDALYSKLLGVTLEMVGDKPVDALLNIVSNHRKALLMAKHHWDCLSFSPSPEAAEGLASILDFFVRTQKPVFKKLWPDVVKAVQDMELQLVLTDKGKKTILGGTGKVKRTRR